MKSFRLRKAFFLLLLLGIPALALSCGHFEKRYDGDPIDEDEGGDGFGPGDRSDDESEDDDLDPGDDDGDPPLPNMSWMDDKGNTIELYDFFGKVVMLNVGAGWCLPCREEAPQLEADLHLPYKDQGFVLIELMVEDNENNPPSTDFMQQWRSEYGLSYIICADPTWSLWDYFVEPLLPFTLILDRDLVSRFSSHGYDKEVFIDLIEEML